MNTGMAIFLAAIIIASVFAVSHRYTVSIMGGANNYSVIWRVDQWTGDVLICDYGTGHTEPGCAEPTKFKAGQ
jgi:hypothetical protein